MLIYAGTHTYELHLCPSKKGSSIASLYPLPFQLCYTLASNISDILLSLGRNLRSLVFNPGGWSGNAHPTKQWSTWLLYTMGSPVHVHFQQQIYPTINNNMHHYQLYPMYPLYPRFYAVQNDINPQSMLTIVNPIHLYQPVNLYQPRWTSIPLA